MKMKILSFIMAICLFLTIIAFTACAPEGEPLTNAELAVLYKEVEVETWAELGVDDPTAPSSQTTMLSTIPDKRQETTDTHQVYNIKLNANTMASVIYMVSLLYENERFETTNDIAIFDANVTVFQDTFSQNFVLKTAIDKPNNKVYLETIVTVMGTSQYSKVDVDYNFATKELIAFRYMANIMTSFVDMGLTADGKNMWFETSDLTDTYAVAMTQGKTLLEEASASVEKLPGLFSEEVQSYMTILEQVKSELQ